MEKKARAVQPRKDRGRMTPEEAIEILEEVKELDDTLYAYNAAYMEALEVALFALKEIQNYRKLGTLEELARAKKYIDLAKKHGTIGEMIDECAEYESIGTVEECREAVEKQKAKKCVIDSCPDHTHYKCPSCGKIHLSIYKCGCLILGSIPRFCEYCGQALIDNDLEGMEE